MEQESTEFIEVAKKFLKQNILVVLLFSVGLLLLGIGLTSLFKNDSQEVVFEKGAGESKTISQPQSIVVDIEGAVLKPGVYTLEKEQRLQDLLIKAGGLSADADRTAIAKQINFAKKLTDSEKIYIPKQSDTVQGAAVAGASSVNSLVNINTASASNLDTLPGVGAATSNKIIEGRPYQSIDDLLNKKIVSKSVFEKIKDKITAY